MVRETCNERTEYEESRRRMRVGHSQAVDRKVENNKAE
jgi:hypothetical protein